jgi:hypothetical protein
LTKARGLVVVCLLVVGVNLLRACLRLIGYRRTCRLLTRTSPRPLKDELSPGAIRAIGAIGRRSPATGRAYGSCLELGLLKWWALRWFRIDSDLQTGIRKDAAGGYYAHAWLVVGGVVLGDDHGAVSGYVHLWNELSVNE